MSAVDNLPGDQRAVLQLVLGRGRSYEAIARLLSINPDAVRDRAVAALRALGPQTDVDPQSQSAITDYLLGQLPEDQIPAVRDRLASSPADRAWARVVASEVTPLAAGPLPEIPTESSGTAPAAAAAEPAAEPDQPQQPQDEGAAEPVLAPTPVAPPAAGEPGPPAAEPAAASGEEAPGDAGEPSSTPPSSRRGGLLVLGLVAAIIIAAVIVLVTSGGGSKHHTSSTVASTPTPPTTSSTSATGSSSSSATTTTTTSSGTSTAAKVVAQINLTPPTATSKAAGIAEVLREGTTNGIAIVAQNVPPNSTSPPNAYAVWLYNSPSDAKILGFVNPGVPKTGKLSTAGGLPANASHYKQLVVTVETSANPKTPGTIILQGTLSGV